MRSRKAVEAGRSRKRSAITICSDWNRSIRAEPGRSPLIRSNHLVASHSQFCKQLTRRCTIFWAVTICYAVVDRLEESNCFVDLALISPKPAKVDSRAQFPNFAALCSGDVEGCNEVVFRDLWVVIRHGYGRLQPVEVGQGIRLACLID